MLVLGHAAEAYGDVRVGPGGLRCGRTAGGPPGPIPRDIRGGGGGQSLAPEAAAPSEGAPSSSHSSSSFVLLWASVHRGPRAAAVFFNAAAVRRWGRAPVLWPCAMPRRCIVQGRGCVIGRDAGAPSPPTPVLSSVSLFCVPRRRARWQVLHCASLTRIQMTLACRRGSAVPHLCLRLLPVQVCCCAPSSYRKAPIGVEHALACLTVQLTRIEHSGLL